MDQKRTTPRARGGAAKPGETRELLLAAALRSLAEHGYAGTSARVIAAAAGTTAASVNYHFGSVQDLLVEAMRQSNERRLERYRKATADVESAAGLIATWQQLHDEDVAVGHIGAMVALLGATTSAPELRPQIAEIFAPWLDFVGEKVTDALAGTPIAAVFPTEQASFVVLALFVGVELLTNLDGNEDRAAELFRAGEMLAALASSGVLGTVLGGGSR
jgi:AcrR family transcriptional regulator